VNGLFLGLFFISSVAGILGTFKTIKKRLVDEGYDITLVSDKIFYYDNKIQKFVELTKKIYTDLRNGNIRL